MVVLLSMGHTNTRHCLIMINTDKLRQHYLTMQVEVGLKSYGISTNSVNYPFSKTKGRLKTNSLFFS